MFLCSMQRRRTSADIHYRLAVFRRDDYRCRHCGLSEEDGATLEVDHVVPVGLGGGDHFENLQTLCRACNRRKGSRFVG